MMGGSLRRQGQGCRASPMRSDESTWQLGLAKATISSSSSSAGIFLPSSWGRSCRGPHSPPAEIDHGKIADGGPQSPFGGLLDRVVTTNPGTFCE